jgi:hypothetical protein
VKFGTGIGGLLSLLLSCVCVCGQQAITPTAGYVYPAGGRQGATLEVTVGGQFLDGVTNAFLSGAGLSAQITDYFKPLTPQQANKLRDELKELQEKRIAARPGRRNRLAEEPVNKATWTAVDEKRFQEIRKKLATFVRRPMNPGLGEKVTLQITIETNAPPGQHQLKLLARQGLSNPLFFEVGELPEVTKSPPRPEAPPARPFRAANESTAVAPTLMNASLPVTVNGQVLPGGVDHYSFRAKQGQHLVASVSARQLIPFVADAVPGWFQATLSVSDSQGKELAYNDDFRFRPDPVLHFDIPEDGQYTVEIKDALYRGREDFVYRLTIGELPFITSIFPLGGSAGRHNTILLSGWNLPGNTLTRDDKATAPGVYQVTSENAGHRSNPVPFAVSDLPETSETEPNNTAESTRELTLPVIVNGRIDAPGDVDTFCFAARGGQIIVLEVLARRLDSPLDSTLKLMDPAGQLLACSDDSEDKAAGLYTHHADSYLRTIVPSNGVYFVQIADAQAKGGPEHAYRFRLSTPRPDFELRIVPSSVNARAGLPVPLTVYALRKDGFPGPIDLMLKDAPRGSSLSGARIPEGMDKIRFTFTPPPGNGDRCFSLQLEGRADIGGVRVSRPAVPAEDMMQAFAYHHLVPADVLDVSVSSRTLSRFALRLDLERPLRLPQTGSATVRLLGTPFGFAERLELELSDPPEGIRLGGVSSQANTSELQFLTDKEKAKPGAKGNLIVTCYAGKAMAAAKSKKQANARRIPLGVLPAIPFEIVR